MVVDFSDFFFFVITITYYYYLRFVFRRESEIVTSKTITDTNKIISRYLNRIFFSYFQRRTSDLLPRTIKYSFYTTLSKLLSRHLLILYTR